MKALLILALAGHAAPMRAPVRLAPPGLAPRVNLVPPALPTAVLQAPTLSAPKLAPTPLAAAPNFTPVDYLAHAKRDPVLAREYAKSVGVDEGHSLEKHTLMVMGQAEKYLSHRMGSRRELFRAVLALHDIGKPRALEARNMTRQHEFIAPIVREQLGKLGFSPEEARLGAALVGGDPIGSFLKGGDPERAEYTLRKMIESSGAEPREFVNLLLAVYMADASSYTTDAGGPRSLDWLFSFDRENKRMRLVPDAARRLSPFLDKVLK